MEYGNKFYHTGGCTILDDGNIDDLIFRQKEEIKTIQNTCDQTSEIKITIKALREELSELRDLKCRTPWMQMDLFPKMEAV